MALSAFHRCYIFPRLLPVTRLYQLFTGAKFSRACCWSHGFISFSLVLYFPALFTGHMALSAFHWLLVSYRPVLISVFHWERVGWLCDSFGAILVLEVLHSRTLCKFCNKYYFWRLSDELVGNYYSDGTLERRAVHLGLLKDYLRFLAGDLSHSRSISRSVRPLYF